LKRGLHLEKIAAVQEGRAFLENGKEEGNNGREVD